MNEQEKRELEAMKKLVGTVVYLRPTGNTARYSKKTVQATKELRREKRQDISQGISRRLLRSF